MNEHRHGVILSRPRARVREIPLLDSPLEGQYLLWLLGKRRDVAE